MLCCFPRQFLKVYCPSNSFAFVSYSIFLAKDLGKNFFKIFEICFVRMCLKVDHSGLIAQGSQWAL